jgi:hypothetical protein
MADAVSVESIIRANRGDAEAMAAIILNDEERAMELYVDPYVT